MHDRLAHACQVLGVSHHASKTEITKAYKELARKHHPDKSPSDPELAAEAFKQIKNAYDILMEAITEDDSTETRNAEQSATSASNAEDWLQPVSIPPFEVAYKKQKWYEVNEETSQNMYAAYLASTPGYYTELVTANGKGGTRQYRVDWECMIQTNIESGRQRSVRFRGLQQDGEHGPILTGKLRK